MFLLLFLPFPARGKENPGSLDLALEHERLMLDTFDFVQPGLSSFFDLTTSGGRAVAKKAFRRLLKEDFRRVDSSTSSVLEMWEPFAVSRLLWLQTYEEIDATDAKLRHFFDVNRSHYPDLDQVSGFRLRVPAAVLPDETASRTLDDLSARIHANPAGFGAIAYGFNDAIGQPGTGFFSSKTGSLPADEAALFLDHPLRVPFGPLPVHDGWLFGEVLERHVPGGDAFEAWKDRVAGDYRREWTKLTLRQAEDATSAALHPVIHRFSPVSGPEAVAYAFSIDGRWTTMTFARSRKRFPNRIGSERDPRFWDALADSSLRAELDMMSTSGQAIRRGKEFLDLKRAVLRGCPLGKTIREKIAKRSRDEKTLRNDARQHRREYAGSDIADVVRIYYPVPPGGWTRENAGPFLELKAFARQTSGPVGMDILLKPPKPLYAERVDAKSIDAMPREIQAAISGVPAESNSRMFTFGKQVGFLHVVRLQQPPMPPWDSIRERVGQNYRGHLFEKYWKDTLGLKP